MTLPSGVTLPSHTPELASELPDIEAWAEQYIRTCDLGAKLNPPPAPRNFRDGAQPTRIASPGRPPEFRSARRGERTPKHEALKEPYYRARTLHAFFHHWLHLDKAEDLAKDPKAYPGFDEAVAADLRASLGLFLDEVVWGKDSDYRRLLTEDTVLLNERLAKFYGVELPAGEAEFRPVALDPGHRRKCRVIYQSAPSLAPAARFGTTLRPPATGSVMMASRSS